MYHYIKQIEYYRRYLRRLNKLSNHYIFSSDFGKSDTFEKWSRIEKKILEIHHRLFDYYSSFYDEAIRIQKTTKP